MRGLTERGRASTPRPAGATYVNEACLGGWSVWAHIRRKVYRDRSRMRQHDPDAERRNRVPRAGLEDARTRSWTAVPAAAAETESSTYTTLLSHILKNGSHSHEAGLRQRADWLGAPRWSRLFVAPSARPQLARRRAIPGTTNSTTTEAAPRRSENTRRCCRTTVWVGQA